MVQVYVLKFTLMPLVHNFRMQMSSFYYGVFTFCRVNTSHTIFEIKIKYFSQVESSQLPVFFWNYLVGNLWDAGCRFQRELVLTTLGKIENAHVYIFRYSLVKIYNESWFVFKRGLFKYALEPCINQVVLVVIDTLVFQKYEHGIVSVSLYIYYTK